MYNTVTFLHYNTGEMKFRKRFILFIMSILFMISVLENAWNMLYVPDVCIPVIVDGYQMSMLNTESGATNLDFYHPPDTGVYVYKASAFAVNFGCNYTFFVGFVHRDKFHESIICVLKYKDGSVSFVKSIIKRLPITDIALKYKYHSAFIKCPETTGKDMPIKISLLSPKQGKDNIYVQWINVADRRNHTEPAKEGFAVCLNTIYNQTSVWSLAEWMESQRLMGVDKVILYGYQSLSQDVVQLLEYYQKIGFLYVKTWNHGWPLIHNIHEKPKSSQFDDESIPDSTSLFSSNNDCLYRFGNQYRYLIHIDTDEYIVPNNTNNHKTYADLVEGKEKFNTLYFLHARFCVPDYLHRLNSSELKTMKYLFREPPLPSRQRKAVFKPSSIVTFGIHEPFEWYYQKTELTFNTEEAKLHHYRYRYQKVCSVLDESMLQFEDILDQRVKSVISSLLKSNMER